MNIWTILDEASSTFGDSTAVVDGDLRFTYSQVHARTCALSASLVSMGVGHGDRVAIMEVNSHRYLECYYAAARIGAVETVVPLDQVAKEVINLL